MEEILISSASFYKLKERKLTVITDLNSIKNYKHMGVIDRFKKEYPAHKQNAETIFEDLMTFFWASEKHEQDKLSDPKNESLDFVFIMDEEMKMIDQIWHIFLLYTKDYMDFCQKYFGQYIHHLPDIVPNMPQNKEQFAINLERFLNYNITQLGEGMVARWFGEN